MTTPTFPEIHPGPVRIVCGQTRLKFYDNSLHHCRKEVGHDHPGNTMNIREHSDGERTWEP